MVLNWTTIFFSVFFVVFVFLTNALPMVDGSAKWERKTEEMMRQRRSENGERTYVVNHEFCHTHHTDLGLSKSM